MTHTPRVAVMGSGSWGTAFAMIVADAGADVVLWSRDEELAATIARTRINVDYQPGIVLPDSVTATADPAVALQGADIVVVAIPSQVARGHLEKWAPYLSSKAIMVSLMKGIELGTMSRMSEVIAQATGVPAERIAVVSGPNLAREIAVRQPAATTVACVDEASAKFVQDACTTDYFRPYRATDVVGTEIGGAVKNVIALANGIAVGLGYGENAQSSLITRGLAEMARLGVALGANPLTFQGLAGVGDLIATCQSPLSRNRSFGESLGRGLSVADTIAASKQTCEAVKSCEPIAALAATVQVEMPITDQVVRVVHHGKSPRSLLASFMARETTTETH